VANGFTLPACPELTEGAIYCVAEIEPADEDDIAGLILREINSSEGPLCIQRGRFYHTTASYAIDRFRPVYRPRADLIESLLAPVPAAPVERVAA
jgi:hypothetical protein